MTNKTRFSKNSVLIAIQSKIDVLQSHYSFDARNGTAQLKNAELEKIVAYGEFNGLIILRDKILGGYV